jgi:hypothetical protein
MSCCEWCGETSSKRRRRFRGELICKECKDAWDKQPDDGGFW